MKALSVNRVSAFEARQLNDSLPDQAPANDIRRDSPDRSLVSVIVPCYNGAAFLEVALRSALEQSYRQVEVIVIDDGSTDNSPEIARKLPVRYIRQQNRGLAEARNAGIRESKGAYVVFLDADDRLKPEAIETGVRALELRPECAMAVGDHVFISADGSFLGHSTKVDPGDCHYEALLKSNFIEMISSALFRRRIFDEVGGFNSTLPVSEDYELYLRIARLRPMCCHPVVVAEYRRHKGNISLDAERMLTTTLQVLKEQERYIGDDARRQQAYREGIRTWRRQYGRQLAAELARSFSSLDMDPLRRKLRLLADNYPQGLLLAVLLRAIPALAQRNPITNSGRQEPVPARRVEPDPLRRAVSSLIATRNETISQVSVSRPTQTLSR
ncbi:MAG TPA: glycosyltransferase [Acidobacteriaceae bacterium]|nr:glycosyltransferase [Acidobacteriaceae bacterium]